MSRIFNLFFLLLVMSFSANAQSDLPRIVVAPQCLIQNTNLNYKRLGDSNNVLLLKISNEDIGKLNTLKKRQKKICGGFMDVTAAWNKYCTKHAISPNSAKLFLSRYVNPSKKAFTNTLAYKIQYPNQVNQLIEQMNPQNLWTNLTTLSNFKNRNARTEDGKRAANWIKSQVEELANNNHRHDVTVSLIETDGFVQPSVVAKVGNSSAPGIVIGAHLDTTADFSSIQPGADDDGTGSVTVLETLRTLLSSQMQFKKPIYFIWYAAEEQGLIGSQQVVAKFQDTNVPVAAVLHFDLTGYAFRNETTLWLLEDNVDSDLTAFLETLIKTYVKRTVRYTECGYACSDHATWTQNGYIAAMPAESAFSRTNPDIHSSRDTMEKLSLAHMTDYAKLAIGFAVELAEPV